MREILSAWRYIFFIIIIMTYPLNQISRSRNGTDIPRRRHSCVDYRAVLSAMYAEKDVQQVLVNGLFRTFLLFWRRLRQRWRMTSATSRRRATQWRNPPRVLRISPSFSLPWNTPYAVYCKYHPSASVINYVGGKYCSTRWCEKAGIAARAIIECTSTNGRVITTSSTKTGKTPVRFEIAM